MTNKLTLRPKDYLITADGGLKIENVSKDMIIEVDMPETITVSPLVIEGRTRSFSRFSGKGGSE